VFATHFPPYVATENNCLMCSVLGGFGNRRSSQRNASVVIKLNIFRLFFGGASQKLPKKKYTRVVKELQQQ